MTISAGWAAIRPALKTLLASLTELDTVWENQRRGFTSNARKATCLLKIKTTASKGVADVRTRFEAGVTPDLDTIVDKITEVTPFILSVKIEGYEQGDGAAAIVYLDRARLRMNRGSTTEALNAVNVAYVGCLMSQELDAPVAGHMSSVAVMDLQLTAMVSEDDIPAGFIETTDDPEGTISGGVDGDIIYPPPP